MYRYGQFVSSLWPNVFEFHAVRGGVEVEAGVAGDEHVAGRQHLRALAPHNDVVTCEEQFSRGMAISLRSHPSFNKWHIPLALSQSSLSISNRNPYPPPP